MNYLINKIITDLKSGLNKNDVQYVYFGHSYSLPGDVLSKGAIEVIPISSEITSVATGIIDQVVNTLSVVLIKSFKSDAYINASKETAADYLTRVMDGRLADGSLKSNSIRYILRTNMKNYGTVQRNIGIEYNSNDSDYEGAATAKITLTQEENNTQPIS